MSNDLNTYLGLQKRSQTTIISTEFVRRNLAQAPTSEKTTSVLTQNKIMLFVLGMVERIDFSKTPIVTLGRYDRHLRTSDQLDLTNYGAVERGVSRNHCKLEFKENQVIVTDLGSANGTFVSGNRIDANKPYTLKKGEELTLGRLPVQFIAER